ncbi:MAG TPA: helix-turn-helix domain-containing protein [Actinophytocola sp.]|uniref:PucR family transcriptional regulator n=1 Tax=Actinophytocola sp. TaxID=1872138 RepID=UPI002DB8F3F0|nr:helix-turn-helix domain-containing protein [Actinophytocola sp.]HEU5470510.1 helix-turn-helix domain-containing protein [Actinophytocola sp.]
MSAELAGTKDRASTLWAALPRDAVIRFRPMVGQLTREMIREIQRAVPAYAQPLTGRFGAVMTMGVEQAVLSVLDSAGTGRPLDESWANVFRRLGRVEFHEGRSLDALQTAYRVGGRVAWRHVSAWAQQQRLPVGLFSIAAEAIFAYVEEISTLSIKGYTAARAESAELVDRHRRRLVELVLAEPPAAHQAIAKQATLAHWRIPDTVAAVVVEQRDDQHELSGIALPGDVLADLDGPAPCLILSNPRPPEPLLGGALADRTACVGPTVRLADAAQSLRWARRTLDLVRRGIIAADGPVWSRDHLSTLWLSADEFVVGELARRALAPLSGLTDKQRARVGETVLAWLDTRGSAPEIARRLGIHPQTVRYRMRQVDKLFGASLADPGARLELEIALRSQRLRWPELEPLGSGNDIR